MKKLQKIEVLLKDYSYFKSRIIFLEKEKNLFFSNPFPNENRGDSCLSADKSNGELEQMKYKVELMDMALAVLKDFDERYKIIIENYYMKKVRMEDIADSMHTSRSRCYELWKEALACMTKLIYGDDIIQFIQVSDDKQTTLN